MIRVPLGDLRVAFENPMAYARTFRPGGREGGPSKYGMFLFAIGEYHRSNDLVKAEEYLEEKLVKNFLNVKADVAAYVGKLRVYDREFRRLGNIFVRTRDNISVPLPAQLSDYVVSGQAARIDLLASSGYGIWVFVRNVPDWAKDPRMPLLQSAYAQRLNVNINEITVGVYDFELGQHSARRYSQAAIDQAKRSLRSLLQLIKRPKP